MSVPQNPQQQNPPQSNIPHQTQIHFAQSPHKVPPPLNPLVNPTPVIPPQQLVNPQPPVIPLPIPASTATPTRPEHSTAKLCRIASNPPGTVSYGTKTSPEL